jgi:hypothetical protein
MTVATMDSEVLKAFKTAGSQPRADRLERSGEACGFECPTRWTACIALRAMAPVSSSSACAAIFSTAFWPNGWVSIWAA